MRSRFFKQIETFLSYIPLCFLLLWCGQVLFGMITINPYGTYVISFVPNYVSGSWTLGRHIRGFTLISITVCYIVVFYMTSYLRPILRTACSVLISFVGLIHYEFLWHVGLQIISGAGQWQYWGSFSLCMLMFLHYVNIHIKILDLSRSRIKKFVCFYGISVLLWVLVITGGFYQQFLAYIVEEAPDPHNLLLVVNRIVGIVMWVTIVRCGNGEK